MGCRNRFTAHGRRGGAVSARRSCGTRDSRGSDSLLALPDAEPALAELLNAAESGRLPADRIDQAVTRLLRAKARIGLHKNKLVDLDVLSETFGLAQFAKAAQEIADRGITLLRNTANSCRSTQRVPGECCWWQLPAIPIACQLRTSKMTFGNAWIR